MHIVLRLKKLAYHSYGSHRCLTLLTLCNGYQCQYILSLELRFIVKNTRALKVNIPVPWTHKKFNSVNNEYI